jgi:hypothetical protein
MPNLKELNRAIERDRRLLADIEDRRSYYAGRGETYQAIQAASEAQRLRNSLVQLIDRCAPERIICGKWGSYPLPSLISTAPLILVCFCWRKSESMVLLEELGVIAAFGN